MKGLLYVSENVYESPFVGEVKEGLKTAILGRSIHYFQIIESTNKVARELAENGAFEGTVVIAEEQTEGRGRRGRSWFSSPENLLLSVILRPDTSPSMVHIVTLMAGVAVAKTIRQYGINARIKWPNDIIINNKKVCGILSEVSAEKGTVNYVILGIGINVNVDINQYPEEIKEKATSLKAELGKELPRIEFLQSLLWELEYEYKSFNRDEHSTISDEYKELSDTLGSWVQVTTEKEVFQGEAIEINHYGALVLKLQDGTFRTIFTGDCTHCRSIGI
ncbi:MAG: biotin--[acetyl-CoA-carboxylase] ligase [Halobacteriota archaeon]|nr:biotin--[acetyl-CoA-carboxylase] ligase [Halobacteriota archaeon]